MPQKSSKSLATGSMADRPLLSGHGYWKQAMSPWHILLFLAPLVAFYEIGSIMYLVDPASGIEETIRARKLMAGFFEQFGAVGLFLPGIAMVTVLLLWHILLKESWRVRPIVLGCMLLEAVLWTLPLFVLSLILQQMLAGEAPAVVVQGAEGLRALGWQARLTIAIGAGLYEELLFRMIAIAAIHMLLVDIAKTSETTGRLVAVFGSALAFAMYHDLAGPDGSLSIGKALFFFLAGLYFGGLYIVRGFGIVVAVHAFYDALVLVLIPQHGG